MKAKTTTKEAGLIGAAVGTAVGVGLGAAAVALSSEDTRKKLSKSTGKLTKKAVNVVAKGKKEAGELGETLTEKVVGLTKKKKAHSSTLKNNTKALASVKKKPTKKATKKA